MSQQQLQTLITNLRSEIEILEMENNYMKKEKLQSTAESEKQSQIIKQMEKELLELKQYEKQLQNDIYKLQQ